MKRLLVLGLLILTIASAASSEEVEICDYVTLQMQIIEWQNNSINELREALDSPEKAEAFKKKKEKFETQLQKVQKAIMLQNKVFKLNCTKQDVES